MTQVETPDSPPKTGASKAARTAVRPEIQALRAAAVLIVVVYHLWPGRLSGGFVGVDVFFAISGFLITAHLVREAVKTGTVSLPRFWARRVRRLLPASLLVLAAAGVATWIFVPRLYWQQFFGEIAASATYWQNWLLANNAVDYLAADNDPSPVQHFWSLSVEEQFYLVWPILVLLATLVAGKAAAARSRKLIIGVVLGVIAVASLVFSIYLTAADPGTAYFITPTRAWEFAAGGLLALVAADPLAGRERLRAIVAWSGWIAIGLSVVFFNDLTPFPSYTALLPVLGTLAVIWAGAPGIRWSPTWIASLRPVQFFGDISYSLYLWHWPLIVIVPFAIGGELTWPVKLVMLAGAIILAWLTKILVEDPFRTKSFFASHKPRWSFVGMVVAMALIVAGTNVGITTVERDIAAANARAEQAQADAENAAENCFGAAALAPENAELCGPNEQTPFADILPTPDTATANPDKCFVSNNDERMRVCTYEQENASAVWALVGDSHADALAPTVRKIAEANNAELRVITKGSCPLTEALRGVGTPISTSCDAWNGSVQEYLSENTEISKMFVSASAYNKFQPEGDLDWFDSGIAGYHTAWDEIPDTTTSIVVIRDVARQWDKVPECITANPDDYEAACASNLEEGILDDPLLEAAKSSDDPRISIIDPIPYMCDDDSCPVVIGGVLVYRDQHHLTVLFAETLAPLLMKQMEENEA